MSRGLSIQSGERDASGLRRFKRTMREAGDDLSDLKESNAKAAKTVEPVAVNKTPKLSGTLAGTIRSSGTKAEGVIRAGSRSVPYAGVIHYGTERAISAFWSKRRIVGKPFVAEAARETEHIWAQFYADALDRAIQRIQGA